MSETVSWDEEVLLANGQRLSVHRKATYGPDEWGRSGQGGLKEQSMRFYLDGKNVKWENSDKWPIHYMPDILDVVGKTPVLVMPVHRWGPCKKYDFPQEGLVAFVFREGDWSRIPLADLPTTLKVNLLRNTHSIRYSKEHKGKLRLAGPKDFADSIRYSKEHKGKLITPQEKLMLEAGNSGPKQGQSILVASQIYAASEDSCARIRPLPNPLLESAAEKTIKAEINAPTQMALVGHASRAPQTISSEEFLNAKGNWTGSGYLSSSCKGIVDDIVSIRQYQDGGSWQMVGYTLVLKNGNLIPIKQPGIKLAQAPDSMEAVVCVVGDVLAIKRQNKNHLIVHRFAQTGVLTSTLRVELPDFSQYFQEGIWPIVWAVQARGDYLDITLGNYASTKAENLGGVLEQQATYTVRLPK